MTGALGSLGRVLVPAWEYAATILMRRKIEIRLKGSIQWLGERRTGKGGKGAKTGRKRGTARSDIRCLGRRQTMR